MTFGSKNRKSILFMKINNFSLHVATANGSGSQSSNNVLIKAIFRMGIPVSGKNLFPSNIQGLPTWFTIRVNEKAYLARKPNHELVVCMNPATFQQDWNEAPSGCYVIKHDSMKPLNERDDLVVINVPFKDLIAAACPEVKLRKLAINMVYVGIIAELIGIEEAAIQEALENQFKTKKKVIDLNSACIEEGRRFVRDDLKLEKFDLKLERRDLTKGKILIEGNTAAGLGAVFGGFHFLSWYPITPSSSLAEAVTNYAEQFRKDKNGKRTFAIVQAEDELAAVGMVIGASWMGGRALTATSGPGISLMAEFSGLSYFAEIPGVIWDVQRVGPSTGLPTRTAQQDVLSCATLSHGDTQHPCLYPATVKECFEYGKTALDLAEQLQTMVFVLSDLDLGMNSWMSEPFEYPKESWSRGKIMTEEEIKNIQNYGRYRDVDGDGICYRTLPGFKDPRGVYFTRGTGHNEQSGYTESPVVFEELLNRLKLKMKTAAKLLPQPVLEKDSGSSIGLIAYGSSHESVREAIHILEEQGRSVDYLRLRAYPFSDSVREFIDQHDQVIVIEQNRDAQMLTLLKAEPELKPYVAKLDSLLHYNGLPLPADFIVEQLQNYLKKAA